MLRRFFIQTLVAVSILAVCLGICAADDKPGTDDFGQQSLHF